jgi:hypothetical protein
MYYCTLVENNMTYIKKDGTPRKKVVSKYQGKFPVGTRIGKWTVMSEEIFYNKSYNAMLLCKCDCGTEKKVYALSLDNGDTTGCNCRSKNSVGWKGYEDLSGSYISNIKRSAKNRNIEYNITPKELWEQYERQNKVCALSGVPLTMTRKYDGNASLDRIDSSKGYVAGNIQWVDKRINIMKNNMSDAELIDWCKKILSFRSEVL